jgi:hypothetical protein
MGWTPSIVPAVDDTVYLVVDDLYDFAQVRIWPEAICGQTDRETVINDIISAQYNDPFQVVAFNIRERWSKDVSAEIASEVRRRFEIKDEDVPDYLQSFVEHYTGRARQLSLRLA